VTPPNGSVPDAAAVLAAIARHNAVMQLLDSDPCTIEHVSLRDPNGPDRRIDLCPCGRGPDGVGAELGEGQYISSARHTLADVVRDVMGDGE
jgi:hypothetical protein